jgi:hypothetical protein
MLFHAVFPLEPLDPSGRIDQPLRACIEGVASRANLDMNLRERRTRFEGIAACASNRAATIVRMNCSFHWLIVGIQPIPPNITTNRRSDNSPAMKRSSPSSVSFVDPQAAGLEWRLRNFQVEAREQTVTVAIKRIVASSLVAALLCVAGCGSHTDTDTTPGTPVTFEPEPDALSSAAPAPAGDSNAAIQANIDRYYGSETNHPTYGPGPVRPPGDAILGNQKAEQYGDFTYVLARRTLDAAQDLETDKLSQRKMRDDLHPVVLTAVMDPVGRLTEIVIDQHSGDEAVDQIFIAACKKALWSRNPPPGARADNDTYRLRISGKVTNYTFDRYGKYTYKTQVELSLL